MAQGDCKAPGVILANAETLHSQEGRLTRIAIAKVNFVVTAIKQSRSPVSGVVPILRFLFAGGNSVESLSAQRQMEDRAAWCFAHLHFSLRHLLVVWPLHKFRRSATF